MVVTPSRNSTPVIPPAGKIAERKIRLANHSRKRGNNESPPVTNATLFTMATRPDILIDEWLSKSRQVTFAIPEARDGELLSAPLQRRMYWCGTCRTKQLPFIHRSAMSLPNRNGRNVSAEPVLVRVQLPILKTTERQSVWLIVMEAARFAAIEDDRFPVYSKSDRVVSMQAHQGIAPSVQKSSPHRPCSGSVGNGEGVPPLS
jgi:hypothetical protein